MIGILFLCPKVYAEGVYDRVLSKALWDGDAKKITMAINKGGNVNKITYTNINGMPLMSVKLLINNGYNINDNEKGCLINNFMEKRKVSNDFYKTIKLLVDNRVSINCMGKYGETSLYNITNHAKRDNEYIMAYRLILTKTNQLNKWSESSDIAFSFKKRPIYSAMIGKNKKVFELLVNAGATVNETSATKTRKGYIEDIGLTALKSAVHLNDMKLVKLVLSKGADINKVQRGMTATDYARWKEYDAIEIFLLDNGGKYNK